MTGPALSVFLLLWYLAAGYQPPYSLLVAIALATLLLAAYLAWRDKEVEMEKLAASSEQQLKRLKSELEMADRPLIQFYGVYWEEIYWFNEKRQMVFHDPYVKIRFFNNPKAPRDACVATDILATITYFDASDQRLLEIDGRWAETEQPSKRSLADSKADLLRTTLNIGDKRSIDVAFYSSDDSCFYAYNNDSYDFQSNKMKHPRHKLSGSVFTAEVRLRGVRVDERFRIKFGLNDDGTLSADPI